MKWIERILQRGHRTSVLANGSDDSSRQKTFPTGYYDRILIGDIWVLNGDRLLVGRAQHGFRTLALEGSRDQGDEILYGEDITAFRKKLITGKAEREKEGREDLFATEKRNHTIKPVETLLTDVETDTLTGHDDPEWPEKKAVLDDFFRNVRKRYIVRMETTRISAVDREKRWDEEIVPALRERAILFLRKHTRMDDAEASNIADSLLQTVNEEH